LEIWGLTGRLASQKPHHQKTDEGRGEAGSTVHGKVARGGRSKGESLNSESLGKLQKKSPLVERGPNTNKNTTQINLTLIYPYYPNNSLFDKQSIDFFWFLASE
jgi:hypothetical protein